MITEQQMMELAAKVNGVYLHMDNAFGGQCWDSAAWIANHFGLPVINTGGRGRWPGWAGNMVDAFPQTPAIAAAYELVDPSQRVRAADTLVWDNSYKEWFPATHVATAVKADSNGWVLCLSQNSSAPRPDLPGYSPDASGPTILQHLPKKGLLGIIRPRTGTITSQSTTTIPKEWDEMASKEEIFEAVWGGPGVPLIHNNELGRGEYPKTILGAMTDRIIRQQLTPLRQEVAAQNAQIANLISALANVSKGEPFDEAKLLAGVQSAAEAGVKNAIESIDTTITIKEG